MSRDRDRERVRQRITGLAKQGRRAVLSLDDLEAGICIGHIKGAVDPFPELYDHAKWAVAMIRTTLANRWKVFSRAKWHVPAWYSDGRPPPAPPPERVSTEDLQGERGTEAVGNPGQGERGP